MSDKETAKRLRQLRETIDEEGVRIRRYTMDPRLKKPVAPDKPDLNRELREQLQKVWDTWFALKGRFRALPAGPDDADLAALEAECDRVERAVDIVQRELISEASYQSGVFTVGWLTAALLFLSALYLYTHGVRSADFSTFEPWSEWGPMKYGEVAFWSTFGTLCYLLFQASHYLARRDFDDWYRPWYVTTFVRAPFLTVILMLVVLEFVEWYGEDTWIQTYLLEEGTKFYFIVFLSFCLGLATDVTAGILRDLAEGVAEFVSRVAGRIADKLGSAVAKDACVPK